MSNFEELAPEAEKQRLILEQWLESAKYDMENGCRLYKNIEEHVLPFLEALGLQVSQTRTKLRSIANFRCRTVKNGA